MSGEIKPQGQLLIYSDGALNLQVRLDGQTVWLTQAAMAELFQTTPQNITLHLQNIYDEGELLETATCKEYLQVRAEGTRQVQRSLRHYNLDMILAVGYRVRSPRGTAFPTMGDYSVERIARQGLHAGRRTHQGRSHDRGRLLRRTAHVLAHAGRVSHQQAEEHARDQYEQYERQRRELAKADSSDFDEAAKRLTEQAPGPKPRRSRKKTDDQQGGDE